MRLSDAKVIRSINGCFSVSLGDWLKEEGRGYDKLSPNGTD